MLLSFNAYLDRKLLYSLPCHLERILVGYRKFHAGLLHVLESSDVHDIPLFHERTSARRVPFLFKTELDDCCGVLLRCSLLGLYVGRCRHGCLIGEVCSSIFEADPEMLLGSEFVLNRNLMVLKVFKRACRLCHHEASFKSPRAARKLEEASRIRFLLKPARSLLSPLPNVPVRLPAVHLPSVRLPPVVQVAFQGFQGFGTPSARNVQSAETVPDPPSNTAVSSLAVSSTAVSSPAFGAAHYYLQPRLKPGDRPLVHDEDVEEVYVPPPAIPLVLLDDDSE